MEADSQWMAQITRLQQLIEKLECKVRGSRGAGAGPSCQRVALGWGCLSFRSVTNSLQLTMVLCNAEPTPGAPEGGRSEQRKG